MKKKQPKKFLQFFINFCFRLDFSLKYVLLDDFKCDKNKQRKDKMENKIKLEMQADAAFNSVY